MLGSASRDDYRQSLLFPGNRSPSGTQPGVSRPAGWHGSCLITARPSVSLGDYAWVGYGPWRSGWPSGWASAWAGPSPGEPSAGGCVARPECGPRCLLPPLMPAASSAGMGLCESPLRESGEPWNQGGGLFRRGSRTGRGGRPLWRGPGPFHSGVSISQANRVIARESCRSERFPARRFFDCRSCTRLLVTTPRSENFAHRVHTPILLHLPRLSDPMP